MGMDEGKKIGAEMLGGCCIRVGRPRVASARAGASVEICIHTSRLKQRLIAEQFGGSDEGWGRGREKEPPKRSRLNRRSESGPKTQK